MYIYLDEKDWLRVVMNALLFSATGATIASSAYTLYKVHPYVPYSFIWINAVVPVSLIVMKSIKDIVIKPEAPAESQPDIEFYNVIVTVDKFGMVEKTLMFLEEPTFTYLGVEYDNDEYKEERGPVFL
jgi:hypothetical protein